MKRLISLFVCVIVAGCQGQTKQDNTSKIDPIKYPLVIDSGKKIVYQRVRMIPGKGWEVYLDTITFTNGEFYQKDSVQHPLWQFGLSYPEWKTISCIISVDENDYLDKSMIGLIEKTGALRINYQGQKIYLSPTKTVKMKEGEWIATFKNDSLEIQVSGQFENKRILGHLTGFGNLLLRTSSHTITEAIYLVYEKE